MPFSAYLQEGLRMISKLTSRPVFSPIATSATARIVLLMATVLAVWTQESSACGKRRCRQFAASACHSPAPYVIYYSAEYVPVLLASPQSPSSQTQASEPSQPTGTQASEPSQPVATQEELDEKMATEANRIQREVERALIQQQ